MKTGKSREKVNGATCSALAKTHQNWWGFRWNWWELHKPGLSLKMAAPLTLLLFTI